MKPKLWMIIGGVLLVIVTVFLVWILQPGDLEVYKKMVENKEYTEARTALEEVLEKNPDWHEARALLADLELDDGQPLAALTHIISCQGNWDTTIQEERLLEMLTLENGQDCIELLEASQSAWAREFALEIALKLNSPELARRTLLPFFEVHPLSPLVSQGWDLAGKDLVEAWKLAAMMRGKYEDELLAKLVSMSESEREQVLPLLLQEDPNLPELITHQAAELGGLPGLKLLLSLENVGWKPETDSHYSNLKLTLLLNANLDRVDAAMLKYVSWDSIESRIQLFVNESNTDAIEKALQLLMAMEAGNIVPEDQGTNAALKLTMLQIAFPAKVDPSFFAGIAGQDLYALAKDWVSYSSWDRDEFPMETTMILLDYLSRDPQYRDQALLLKEVASPPPEPQPGRIFYSEQRRDQGQLGHWEVSPDQRHVLYCGWGSDAKTYWYDMVQQKHVGEYDQPLFGTWDPENSRVALTPKEEGEKIFIYNTDTAARIAEFAWTDSTVLGWRNDCLLLAHPQGTGYKVEVLDPETNKRSIIATTPVLPSLSYSGELGFITGTQDGLQVTLGENETTYTGSWTQKPWVLHGWLPQDKGLLLRAGSEFAIFTFQDQELLSLDIEGFEPHSQGWLDDNRIAGIIQDGIAAVVILDIRDMSWVHTGIDWHQYGRLEGDFACRFQDGNLYMFPLR